MAKLAEVRLLALTHVSPRYVGAELAREARAMFPNTVVPRDFDVIEVPFPERGAPRSSKGGGAGGLATAYDPSAMSRMVQVATAGDVTEAEELQELLRDAGIEAAGRTRRRGRRAARARPGGFARGRGGRHRGASDPDDLIAEP